MHKLTIEQGDPSGAVFELSNGENVVGRSSSSRFRVAAADVSGQHVRIVVRGSQAIAENLSRFNTLVDGQPIQGPTVLKPGQKISIGKGTVLRYDADAPVPPPEPAVSDAATGEGFGDVEVTGAGGGAATGAAPRTGAGADLKSRASAARDAGNEGLTSPENLEPEDGATRAMMTRAAGHEEIDFLRQAERRRIRSRFLMIAAGVFVVACVALVVVTRRAPPEQVVSWPVDAEGEPLAASVESPLGGFTVSYPDTGDAEVATMAGGFTVTCTLGQRRDLPLRIVLEEVVDDRYASESMEASIAHWKEQVTAMDSKWNIDPPLPIHLFLGDENGIPFKTLPYQRHEEGSWAGVANILRHGRRLIVLRAEVPAAQRARAEEILYTPFIMPSQEFERSHWEGGKDVPSASTADILSRAHEEQRRLAPATWDDVEAQLIGALRKSVMEKRPDDEADALEMLATLRGKKTLWYNEQLVQKEAALAQGDLDRVRRIAEFCKAVFSDTSDQRFYEVRKW